MQVARQLQQPGFSAVLESRLATSGMYAATADQDGMLTIWDARAPVAGVCCIALGGRPSAIHFTSIMDPIVVSTWSSCNLGVWDLRMVSPEQNA